MTVWRHPAWHVPPVQLAVRAAVPAGTVLVLLSAAATGDVPSSLAVVLGAVSVVAMVLPESPSGLVLLAGFVLVWLLQPAGAVTSPWLLLAAAGLVVVHVALHVAALGPAVMRPDTTQLRLWGLRALSLWAVAALLWLAARWLHGRPTPSGVLVLALMLLGAGLVWFGRELAPTDSDATPDTAEGPST